MSDYMRIRAEIGAPGHLSCSMLGGIFGVSHWDTPYTIAQKYMGTANEEPSEESKESMAMGHAFEDTIARFWAEKRGVHIRRQNIAYCRKDMPWFVCHPDRLVDERVDGKRVALEVKFVSPYARSEWGEEGTDQVPDAYLLQCQGYFFCGVPADEVLIVRMMGNRIRTFVIEKDDELQTAIRLKVTALHDLLVAGKMPEPSTPAEFVAAHPQDNGQSVTADDKVMGLLGERAKLAIQKKGIEGRMDAIDMDIRNYIGDAQILLAPSGRQEATCKTVTTNRFDTKLFKASDPTRYQMFTKTTTSRILRFAK